MVPPTGLEKQYYDQLFDAVCKDSQTGLLPGSDALPFLTASGLPQQTLGEIWGVADPNNNGFLTRDSWYKAARLVGWLQDGQHHDVDASLAAKPGPFPTFAGYGPPPKQPTSNQGPLSAHATGEAQFPPLTNQDKAQFTRIFVGCEPVNGLVGGDKARDVFMKSKLSYDKLGQIWALADTQQRGALDLPDFIIGMWLIRITMANPNLQLPSTLPSGIYEAASGGRHVVGPMAVQHTGSTSPIQRQMTGTLQPQITGQSLSGATSTPPRSTAIPHYQSFPQNVTAPSAAAGGDSWDVTKEAKATYDGFFRQLDKQNKGVIEGDVAVPFMLQSQLDQTSLGQIWELADIRQEGKLDPDEFAVAMYLINSKLAGKDLPSTLPSSLVPPALRSMVAGSQLNPASSTTPKDLFDLFDDDTSTQPVPPAAAAAAFLPQPPSRRGTSRDVPGRRIDTPQRQQTLPSFRPPPLQHGGDLLGDDAQGAASAVPDASADIGNKKNELANTTRSASDLQQTRVDLEGKQASNTTQLEQLESELSAARAKYEEETKLVSDLRVKVGEQTAKLRQLQADVIAAQSDLTAKKMEKDELEQSYLRDKEEVRSLQKRMKEIEDEKTGIKLLLDKVKKDARQQKGMVSIAKKQLSTAEGSRDGLQRELRETENEGDESVDRTPPGHQAEASEVPTTRTHTLSPDATGASQRSLNPFERLSRTSQSQPVASPTGSFSDFPSFPQGGTAPAAAIATTAGAAAVNAKHEATGTNTNEQERMDSNKTSNQTLTQDVDAFGMPVREGEPFEESDPFSGNGAGKPPQETAFGDSFGTTTPGHAAAGSPKDSDFDATFADFEAPSERSQHPPIDSLEAPPAETQASVEQVVPEANTLKHAAPPTENNNADFTTPTLGPVRPDVAERTVSTQAIAPASLPSSPPLNEPVASSQDNQSLQQPSAAHEDGAESSDDDEGPEDIDGPRRSYPGQSLDPNTDAQSPVQPSLSSATMNTNDEEHHPKTRRSAPPPPTTRSTSTSPTPPSMPGAFGSAALHAPMPVSTPSPAPSPPASSLPHIPTLSQENASTGGTLGQTEKPETFDDEEFDFSDQPPATQGSQEDQSRTVPSAFDDEFAAFDEEFEKTPSQANNGSDKSSSLLQTYEVVPSHHESGGQLDEWGFNNSTKEATIGDGPGLSFEDAFGSTHNPQLGPTSVTTDEPAQTPKPSDAAAAPSMSFDDAFGGSFAPTVPAVATQTPAQPLAPPALPERPPINKTASTDLPQDDDLEDVKRLCAMGFSRSLVVEALDANGYDFQKALNVLLVK